MVEDDADAFVRFRNVRVICSTAPALFCGIGNKRVWLPRRHISGRLWCRGDQGMLHIRRWVALQRHLLDPRGAALLAPLLRSISPRLLRVVRTDREPAHANER